MPIEDTFWYIYIYIYFLFSICLSIQLVKRMEGRREGEKSTSMYVRHPSSYFMLKKIRLHVTYWWNQMTNVKPTSHFASTARPLDASTLKNQGFLKETHDKGWYFKTYIQNTTNVWYSQAKLTVKGNKMWFSFWWSDNMEIFYERTCIRKSYVANLLRYLFQQSSIFFPMIFGVWMSQPFILYLVLKQTIINPQAAGGIFHTLACGPGVFRDTVNHSKSVRNQFTVT